MIDYVRSLLTIPTVRWTMYSISKGTGDLLTQLTYYFTWRVLTITVEEVLHFYLPNEILIIHMI